MGISSLLYQVGFGDRTQAIPLTLTCQLKTEKNIATIITKNMLLKRLISHKFSDGVSRGRWYTISV